MTPRKNPAQQNAAAGKFDDKPEIQKVTHGHGRAFSNSDFIISSVALCVALLFDVLRERFFLIHVQTSAAGKATLETENAPAGKNFMRLATHGA